MIVLRSDLGMEARELVSQASKAGVGALLKLGGVVRDYNSFDATLEKVSVVLHLQRGALPWKEPVDHPDVVEWLEGKMERVCVVVETERELVDMEARAKAAGLITCLVEDADLAAFAGLTVKTALAIGPAAAEKADVLIEGLPLL